jgi:hypothetical protein
VLEQNTVDLPRGAGLAERLDRDGIVHHGIDPSVTSWCDAGELRRRSAQLHGGFSNHLQIGIFGSTSR